MLRKVLRRMGRMSESAWYIFRFSTRLCLLLLSCGLLTTLGGPAQHQLAGAYYDCSEAVLLIGALASVIAEDRMGSR